MDESRQTVRIPMRRSVLPGTKDGCFTYASSRDRLAAQTAFRAASTAQSRSAAWPSVGLIFHHTFCTAYRYVLQMRAPSRRCRVERPRRSLSLHTGSWSGFSVSSVISDDSTPTLPSSTEYRRWLVKIVFRLVQFSDICSRSGLPHRPSGCSYVSVSSIGLYATCKSDWASTCNCPWTTASGIQWS